MFVSEVEDSVEYFILIFIIIVLLATFLALTFLSTWHGKMITRGETSIEACINKSETKRFIQMGRVYRNPYDFGAKENWRRFLGLVNGRTVWRHVLLPSGHLPEGNGFIWETVEGGS